LALAGPLLGSLAGQVRGRGTSIVIVTGQEAPMPIPTLMEGPQANLANLEIADQLFLRLAGLGPTLLTAGDRNFVPLLASSWSRRDSVTLVFDLNPRQYRLDDVLADLRAAGLSRVALRPFFVPQTVTLPRPVATLAKSLERSGPLARLALRFRFTYLVAASR